MTAEQEYLAGLVDQIADAVAQRLGVAADDRPLLDPKQLGVRLGVSERTARQMLIDGKIPSFTVAGGARRVDPAAVDAYLAQRRQGIEA